MHKYVVHFFLWLFPIFKQAAIQVLAEEIHKRAYPNHPYRRPRDGYLRLPAPTSHEQRVRVTQKGTGRSVTIDPNEPASGGYHDVILVAFDISGRSRKHVEEFLTPYFPNPNQHEMLEDAGIGMDSWWFADDTRVEHTDADSAVFVTKGKQDEARRSLRGLNLAR